VEARSAEFQVSSTGGSGYGRFGILSRVELEQFFHLDDEDHQLAGCAAAIYSRLGFALQVLTVRHLGMFLVNPLDAPPELVAYVAEQLGVADPSCVERYLERRETRFEHQREIQRAYGLTPFAAVARSWRGGSLISRGSQRTRPVTSSVIPRIHSGSPLWPGITRPAECSQLISPPWCTMRWSVR
jgi:hypothetical protein